MITCRAIFLSAIGWWRQPVWLQVHQPDSSGQPWRLHAQRECQSSFPGGSMVLTSQQTVGLFYLAFSIFQNCSQQILSKQIWDWASKAKCTLALCYFCVVCKQTYKQRPCLDTMCFISLVGLLMHPIWCVGFPGSFSHCSTTLHEMVYSGFHCSSSAVGCFWKDGLLKRRTQTSLCFCHPSPRVSHM